MFKQVRNTNAFIEREGSVVRLMSYNTLVCEVHTDSKTVLLGPSARYSRTTIKHLSEFLRGFGISYYAAKAVLVSPDSDLVEKYNGYNIYVSYDPRFRFHATAPFCML